MLNLMGILEYGKALEYSQANVIDYSIRVAMLMSLTILLKWHMVLTSNSNATLLYT